MGACGFMLSKRGHKYGAIRTEVDGIRFASKAEARRYSELKMLEKAGKIARLQLQPEFKLYAPRTGIHGDQIVGGWQNYVGTYRADFAYDELTPQATRRVIEDVKGFKTPMYRWKKKHVEAQYGIKITEVSR